jgi:hypothetical protein
MSVVWFFVVVCVRMAVHAGPDAIMYAALRRVFRRPTSAYQAANDSRPLYAQTYGTFFLCCVSYLLVACDIVVGDWCSDGEFGMKRVGR